jgi:hypothetical protein
MKANKNVFPYKLNDCNGVGTVYIGLTARDYIAIQAMTGLLAGISAAYSLHGKPMPSYESIAEDSYKMADAMIKRSEVKDEQSI